ncbi:hypothetical protein GB937_010224 [Aspergillus fischeri]|nr:hypothetical protein GB937_010224 [Aspergillus fischeri]
MAFRALLNHSRSWMPKVYHLASPPRLSRMLRPVKSGSKNLFGDLSRLSASVNFNEFDIERLIPLLGAILKEEPDVVVWIKSTKPLLSQRLLHNLYRS